MKLGFDLETTGVNTSTDKPVQIGLISTDGEGTGHRILMNCLCNPLMPIAKEASEVHGITDADVTSSPDYVVAAWTLKLIVDDSKADMLITMNGKSFDIPMIDNCLGVSVFGEMPHYDILQMAFRYFPGLKSRKLGDLYAHFFNETLVGAHDAVTDIVGTMRVFEAMRAKIGMSYADLLAELNTPKPYAVIPFGKFAGCTIDEVPAWWANFMNKKGQLSPDLQATVDYILRGRAA